MSNIYGFFAKEKIMDILIRIKYFQQNLKTLFYEDQDPC